MHAPLQARDDSDAVQTTIARPATQERSLADNRPMAVAQRKLAEMMNSSPRALQPQALSNIIHDSPRMVAQRHELDARPGREIKPPGDCLVTAKSSLAPREEKANNTGLPNHLKSGIESLSGMSMDHVRVHYNSDKPAQLQAYAYAQGRDIHLAPGKEKHLPHEAWHVVQQAQGRVRPTLQMGTSAVNDDASLENEADMMGERACQLARDRVAQPEVADMRVAGAVTQRFIGLRQSTALQATTALAHATFSGTSVMPVQRMKIATVEQTPEQIKKLIDTAGIELELTLQSKNIGKLVAKFKNEATDYRDEEAAVAAVKTAMSSYGEGLERSKKAKAEGDNTEEATAAIIGGKVNRSDRTGKDVEWRQITRTQAEELKLLIEIPPGSSSDQSLFDRWRDVIRITAGNATYPGLNKVLSTPLDAFSDDTIALAGGQSKFEAGTTKLTATAIDRVNQLKSLASNLNYRPLLVFSAVVTCEMCEAVAKAHGVDVAHLE